MVTYEEEMLVYPDEEAIVKDLNGIAEEVITFFCEKEEIEKIPKFVFYQMYDKKLINHVGEYNKSKNRIGIFGKGFMNIWLPRYDIVRLFLKVILHELSHCKQYNDGIVKADKSRDCKMALELYVNSYAANFMNKYIKELVKICRVSENILNLYTKSYILSNYVDYHSEMEIGNKYIKRSIIFKNINELFKLETKDSFLRKLIIYKRMMNNK